MKVAQTLVVPRLKEIPAELTLFAVIAGNEWPLDLCRDFLHGFCHPNS
jgi:hypothetical protein